jgi:hypothetical protein
MKPNINSVEGHPQLSNNGHSVDGALVGTAFTMARGVQTDKMDEVQGTMNMAQ